MASEDVGETREQPSVPRNASGRAHLVLLEEASATVIDLPVDRETIIGRDDACTVKLDDDAVSRQHTRIILRGDRAEIEDLGSRNGTLLNGEKLEGRHALEIGDAIVIGGTTLLFRRSRGSERAATPLSAEAFRERVDQEVDRSLRYNRTFALVAASGKISPSDLARIAGRIDAVSRIDDVVWWLVPEVDREKPDLNALTQFGTIRAGYAVCPNDACEAASLFAAAREAMTAGEPGRVRSAADQVAVYRFGDRQAIVADSAMLRIYALIRRVAASDLAILLSGETGTGKDVAALAVHDWSPRKGKPFVAINCAALPETLIESELFGHEKGAFSGASSAKAGLFEAAQGGTVFLDEVGELSLTAQAKLLRVLESKRVTRVGDTKERAVDFRIVAATNRKLDGSVESGQFRRDLFFRLSAAKIMLPPLRERTREVPVIARRFLDEACARLGLAPKEFTGSAFDRLISYGWPGNLRELKNLVDYLAAVVLADEITSADLPPELGGVDLASADAAAQPPAQGGKMRRLQDELAELERTRIAEALRAANNVQRRAAELLGMPLRTLVYKLARMDRADGDE